MGTLELDGKIKDLRELSRMKEELEAEMEAITDAIKSEMTARSVDELAGTDWKASWREIKTSRLDTAAIRKALPDLAAKFTITTSARRFCIV